MPSQKNKKADRHYSLFHFELYSEERNILLASWASAKGLEFLDPKDALYRYIIECQSPQSMPETSLVAWNVQVEDDLPDFPSNPCLLKAALGSGGYGLYYVYNKSDALQIIKNHANKAVNVDQFHENLIRDYGCVPYWSLQKIIPSVLINDRKCQIRVYIILCNNTLYVYNTHEVRIPFWDNSCSYEVPANERDFWSNMLSEDSSTTSSVGRSNFSRPYNYGRIKSYTERYCCEEYAELAVYHDAISNKVISTFQALKDPILNHNKVNIAEPFNDENHSVNNVAIAGIDIMVDVNTGIPYIVEINNNPAMPQKEKHRMSEVYLQHLYTFVSTVLLCTLSRECDNIKDDNLIKIW
jgi:hypothetical protein